MKHYNIRIYGRVQRVGFRYWTLRTADNLGIKGFVKNLADGSVYIEAEGDQEQLSEFLIWCRKGADYSNVEEVDVEEASVQNFTSFYVRH